MQNLLESLGFSLVRVVASLGYVFPSSASAGATLTVALAGDGFQTGFDGVTCDHTIDNSDSLDLLRRQVLNLLEGWSL